MCCRIIDYHSVELGWNPFVPCPISELRLLSTCGIRQCETHYFLVAVIVVDVNRVAVIVFVVVTVLVAVVVTGAPPTVLVNTVNTVDVLVAGKIVVVAGGTPMQEHADAYLCVP